jgi:hypothetical protein
MSKKYCFSKRDLKFDIIDAFEYLSDNYMYHDNSISYNELYEHFTYDYDYDYKY